LLPQEQSRRIGKLKLAQGAYPFFAKKVAALRKLKVVLRREQALNAVAEHRALTDEKTSLPQHLLALPRALAWNMDRGNQLRLQKLGQHVGVHLIGFHLCLGDNAHLVGIGQDDVLVIHVRFKNLIKPVPVHRRLKHHAASRIAFDQKLKADRNFVIDTPSLQNRVPVVDDAEDAVMFVEVDADVKRHAWLVCSLAHKLPFYTIDYMRFRSSKRQQSEATKGFHVI
jgi:hypothetical protein